MSTATLTRYASPEVERILKEIRNGESQYDNDLRRSNREDLVLPIRIHTEDAVDCCAFSKDVSQGGVCLITPQAFQQKDRKNLQFHGLRYECDMMPATCSWARQFSNSHWISGWQLDTDIDVAKILQEDLWLDVEQRSVERERLAIPVVVHQKNGQPKIHCFSRNICLSGVCLIGSEEPKTSDFSLLELFRSNGETSRVTAECRWARRIGQSCWISGWQFPRLARIQKFQMRYFQNLPEDDNRQA